MRISLFLFLSWLGACSAETSHVVEEGGEVGFAELLTRGRSPQWGESRFGAQYANELDLPSGVVDLEVDSLSGKLSFAAFDTATVASTQDPESYTIKFIDRYQDSFGFDSSGIAKDDVAETIVLDRKILSFKRVMENRELIGSLVQFSFVRKHSSSDTWALAEITNRGFGEAKVVAAYSDTKPDLDQLLGFATRIESSREIVYPKADAGTYSFIPAQEFVVSRIDDDARFTVVIASSGKILEAVSHRQDAKLHAQVFNRSIHYRNDTFLYPLKGAILSGGARVAEDGEVAASGRVRVGLSSDKVRILSGRDLFTFDMTINGDTVVPSDVSLPALNAYAAIQRVIEFTSRHISKEQVGYLARPIQVFINVQGSCNAFYDGNISLFAESQRCSNMALVNDVVYHEWGHGLDAGTGSRRGITDSAFSEGIGDIVSAYLTGDPNMSPGFVKNRERGIRNLKNDRAFPKDRGQAHHEGTIIGGAFWDMREALIARYGAAKGASHAEKLFFNHLLTTNAYRDSYRTVLRVDDNDSNPATRSPNHCLINKAFAAHGLTQNEACVDEVAPGDPEVDTAIFVAISAESGGGVTFAAASPHAAQMEMCSGAAEPCLRNEGARYRLDSVRVTSGIRVFQATQRVALTDGSRVTILSYDSEGKVRGYREVELKRR